MQLRMTTRCTHNLLRGYMADYDVIVIGGGGAGLAAAVEAGNAGATVLLCECADRIGGSTAVSAGLFYACDTPQQRAMGVHDKADELYDHLMLMNRWEIEAAVARRYADESGPTIEWLMQLGVEFDDYVHTVALSKVPRGHLPKQFGFGLVQALDAAISRCGVEIALNTRVERLLGDPTGGLAGISVDGVEVRAHSIVVATGGLGNADPELRRQYWPDSVQFEEKWHYYIGVDSVRGDAIPLGKSVGALIGGENCGLLINSTSYYHNPEGLFPGWTVYVNRDGRRFISEQADYSIMAHNINRQAGKIMFVIMDHNAFARAPDDPRYRNRSIHQDIAAASLDPEFLAEGFAKGEVICAPSIGELAIKCGIDSAVLEATLDEYNFDVARGYDSHFLKDPATLMPVCSPPFYAVPRRAGQLSTSSVGLKINADAMVYANRGGYVKGLFAGGEAASGPWNHYVGSGSSIGTCMIFGRVAGKNAAAYAISKR
jgi:fumarate reductase flavoprotein subunit